MKIQTQHNPERIKLGELIEDMNVAMLTTISENGDLESRPMAPQEMDSEGAIWFLTDSRSQKTKSIDHVNLTFSQASDGKYVSLSGYAEISSDRQQVHRLWSVFAKPWFPDGPDSPNVILLKFIPTGAEYWDAPHSSTIRLFAMAASIVAGKPIGMGDNETLRQL